MKLTEQEKKALSMMRELHDRQREKLLEQMERQVQANQITERVSGRKLRIIEDKKIERAFGTAPRWNLRARRRGPK